MKYFHSLLTCGLAFLSAGNTSAQDPAVRIEGIHLAGPATPADFPKWLADMKRWRMEYRKRIGYGGSEYSRPELKWTQRSFVQPQMMVEDRYFYDPAAGRYTVDRYLDDLEKRYGGIDSVLVWHTYPNIGIDNRNQFDHFRDLPGGVAGLKQMVADFHRRGVKVLFPIMLWDQGTHDEGRPEYEVLARQLAEIGADGVNGDTMSALPRQFRVVSDQTGHPLAFEPEHLTVDEALAYNNLDWAQAIPPAAPNIPGQRRDPPAVPTVLKYKWLEPRHMTNICDRWSRDKTWNLQFAFFNGVGLESWENVWGIWNEMNPRDAEALRRVAKIERKFAGALISAEWEPHTPTLQSNVYASRFPDGRQTVWTLINRNEFHVSGKLLSVLHRPGAVYYDLWHGVALKPEVRGDAAILSFGMEGYGYGAVLASDAASVPRDLKVFLGEMHKLSQKRLDSFPTERRFLPQQLVEIARTKPAGSAPAGMLLIPAAEYEFQVSGIEIEGTNQVGVDVQYPWEDSPRRNHRGVVQIAPFYMDRHPVTNADFKKFLGGSGYRPKESHNFLRDWKSGNFPDGWSKRPVTWVSLEDARAYAAWAGKRLPHEWEWQYAAQGTDGRVYPWGNAWVAAAVPKPEKGRTLPGPSEVDAHPQGASPFGVEDLVGNVWQWTDEYVDDHTRAGILKGGSYYQPQGSRWYFPQAYHLTEHGKLLMMAPGKDRAGTVGFRCVVDTQ